MSEIPRPFDARASTSYLNSYMNYRNEARELIHYENPVIIKPPPLVGTPYYIGLSLIHEKVDTLVYLELSLADGSIVYFDQLRGGSASTMMQLRYWENSGQDIVVITGSIHNSSFEKSNPNLQTIYNYSGVIAPIEDAICVALAEKTGKRVRREVASGRDKLNRFINNYLNRGYILDSTSSKNVINMHKDF